MIRLILAHFLIASLALSANAWSASNTELEAFMAICRAHRYAASGGASLTASPEIGPVTYVPFANIHANQNRFSFAVVTQKLKKILQNEDTLKLDSSTGKWNLAYDEGRSIYADTAPLDAVYYRGEVYLIDGHHRALVGLYFDSKTLPVRIAADLSADFQPDEFEAYMADNSLSYFRDTQGHPTARVDFVDMQDDPSLAVVRRLLTRVDLARVENVSEDVPNWRVGKPRGRQQVVLLKVNRDIAFLEFEIADALRQAGVDLNKFLTQEPKPGQLKNLLKVLKKAAGETESRLSQVLLLDKPTPVAKLDWNQVVQRHFARRCEMVLTPRLH